MSRFNLSRIGQGNNCPVCRRVIYYGLWAHVETCLKEKQRKADGRFERKKINSNPPYLEDYEKTPEFKAQIKEGYEEYLMGEPEAKRETE